MRLTSRFYLLIVFAPLVVLVSGCVLLNMWMDPLNIIRDYRLSTRTYALPALLAELERPPASESGIDAFLLGTSRTRRGNDTRGVPEVINLGISGAPDQMIDNLLVGLLQTSTRSHVYFVDTMGVVRRNPLEGKSLRYLLSGGTTKLSLRKIAEKIRKRSKPDTSPFPDNFDPKPPQRHRDFDQNAVEKFRSELPIRPNTRAEIERRVQRLGKLSVPHDALVVYYDGPHSLVCLSETVILDALQARARLWRQVVAESNVEQSSSPDDVERPRVAVAYVSYATPAEWGEPIAPEVWTTANWLDASHFNPIAGKALLDRLMDYAAENRQSVRTSN